MKNRHQTPYQLDHGAWQKKKNASFSSNFLQGDYLCQWRRNCMAMSLISFSNLNCGGSKVKSSKENFKEYKKECLHMISLKRNEIWWTLLLTYEISGYSVQRRITIMFSQNKLWPGKKPQHDAVSIQRVAEFISKSSLVPHQHLISTCRCSVASLAPSGVVLPH